MKVKSNRGQQWADFSYLVLNHVENYTIGQYSDMPNDPASGFDIRDFRRHLERYVNRIGRGQRGLVEAKRDCLKMAHYACMLHAILVEQGDKYGKGE